MSRANSLSIVIPAYNEGRRLPATLLAIARYLYADTRFSAHEIIIVDDGSSDDTQDIARRFADEQPNVRVLGDEGNNGKGWALRRGILASRGEYILCTDADLSTPIEEVGKLVRPLEEAGVDIAIGSRKVAGSDSIQPIYRQILSFAGNSLIRVVLQLPFKDTQCGFKLYKREAALRLFKNLQLHRFSFDFEILSTAKKLGMTVAEVGVRWKHSDYSTVRTRDVVQSFFDVFRIRFGLTEPGPSRQLLRFMTVGVVNTALDTGVYIALTRFIPAFSEGPVAAKFFSFLAATISSFFLNRYWTFGMKGAISFREIGRFYAAVSLGLVINVSLMYTLVHVLNVYDLVALGITTLCTFGFNYLLSKAWVFKAGTEVPATAKPVRQS